MVKYLKKFHNPSFALNVNGKAVVSHAPCLYLIYKSKCGVCLSVLDDVRHIYLSVCPSVCPSWMMFVIDTRPATSRWFVAPDGCWICSRLATSRWFLAPDGWWICSRELGCRGNGSDRSFLLAKFVAKCLQRQTWILDLILHRQQHDDAAESCCTRRRRWRS